MKTRISLLLIFTSSLLLAQNKKLTLEDCRQLALHHNKQIQIADQNRLMMNSLWKFAKTQYLPKFGFNGGYIHTNREISLLSDDIFLPVIPEEAIVNGQFDPSVFNSNYDLMRETFMTGEIFGIPYPLKDENGNYIFQNYAYLPKDAATLSLDNVFLLNMGMIQPIYMGGKIRELNNLAKFGEDLLSAKKSLTKTEVILETDKCYWKVVSLKEKVKLTKIYKQMLDSLIRDLNNLFEEGIITKNDVLKTQVKYNEIDLKLLKANNGLQLAKMALNQSIGNSLYEDIQLSDSIIHELIIPNPEKITSEALNNRPEIKMIISTIKMAESGEKILKSRYLPNVGLTANYLFANPNPYNGFEKEFGGDWNVGVLVNIPVWHWNDKKHTLNAMQYKTKAIEIQYEETKELISLEVQQTLFKYSESIKKVEMTQIALQQAEENLKISQDNFDEGIINTTDLLEAQTMWQDAYSEFIEAKTENKLCESEILKVSGKLEN